MPTPALTPVAAPSDAATARTPPAAPIGSGPRYQVEPVLWGYRKRFVVRDTENDVTVAIRTTSLVADGDLMRLNMVPRARHGPGADAPPAPADHPSVPRDRQCGRCRRLFPGDPAGEAIAIEDWWLCELCRDKLLADKHPGAA